MPASKNVSVAASIYPSDLYGYATLLAAEEQAALLRLRSVLETSVRPVIDDHWERGEFPFEIVQPLAELDLMSPNSPAQQGSALFSGFTIFEMARMDASVATFYTAQAGLFRTAVNVGGSQEQVERLDPLIRSFEATGVFCLTEPEHGSDIAGGLATSARRDGDDWVLNGEKRWIGAASSAKYLAIFARDEADHEVKAFLVASDAPGVTLNKIQRKTSLRMVQNADIRLQNVRVSEADRLQRVNSFRDVADMLRRMRSDVAWLATGVQAGAYEAAVRYVTQRQQFGKPLAAFQLIQERLALMLGNLTSSLGMVVRLSQQQHEGHYVDENSALAKMYCSLRMRETVALAREVVGGNGIVLENDVARFHADAEAVYTYEGTHDINALIVGRAITGVGAFR